MDEDIVYEECPYCENADCGCLWCDYSGLVPHECKEEE